MDHDGVSLKEYVDRRFEAAEKAVGIALDAMTERTHGSRSALSLGVAVIALAIAIVSLFLKLR